MRDIYVTVPFSESLRAVAYEKHRDVAGRGYDETRLGLLTLEQTEALRAAIKDTEHRQAAANRKHRISELEAELKQLRADGEAV